MASISGWLVEAGERRGLRGPEAETSNFAAKLRVPQTRKTKTWR